MKITLSGLLSLLLFLANGAYAAQCDIDADGDIDRNDIRSISLARGASASGPDDPRDANGDGIITVQDARQCTLSCTLPRCATPPENQAPSVTSAPVTTAVVGEAYSYDVNATDPDGDTLAYSLNVAPVGMSIDPNSGLIQWTPGSAQAGLNPVAVRVQDPGGLSAIQSFSINVDAGNAPPSITSAPVTTAVVGEAYSYDVNATDPDGDTLAYSLNVAPVGMSIDPNSGLIQWTPGSAQAGLNPVVVRAQDPGGLSAIQSFSINVGPADVTVPDVRGLPQGSAESLIVAEGLVVGAVTTANDDTVPAGDVISQNPTGGTSVAPGTAVDLVVSIGPADVTVPDVVGLPQGSAESLILAEGLVVGAVTTANDDTVPAGDVISQTPTGGTSVAPGTAVDLIVSIGPADVTVPDVVGLSQGSAESLIVAEGLVVGAVTTANDDTVPAGDVISQDPTGGSLVAPGTAVDLVVSIGPADVTAPDVVGLSQGSAESLIVAEGLVVGAVTTANDDTVPAGDVISQDPTGGTSVAPGTAVDLVVSIGPADVTVPDVVGLPQGSAEALIVAEGLVVGAVSTANDDTVPAGDVISQDPTGGSLVAPGTAVDLVVSIGPADVTVPDVVGLPEATANADLITAGLLLGAVTTAFDDTVPEGSVISQNPAAGADVAPATLVDLVVSLGSTVVDSASIVASPTAVLLNAASTISCTAFNADGNEITPTPAFVITSTPSGLISSGDQFASPESGDFDVTCTFTADGVDATTTVQVLPEDSDPSLSEITVFYEDLGDLGDDVVAADEAEDLPGLQAAKNALETLVADVQALTVAEPLPVDADLPTATQLSDAGDVPDPVADSDLVTIITAIQQNIADYDALLAAFDTGTATDADVMAMNDLTAAAEVLADQLDAVNPSVAGVLAVNDEINALYSTGLPNQTAEQAQVLVEVISTAPGIVWNSPDQWQLQPSGPLELYADFDINPMSVSEFYSHEQEAFSLVSVMTSTAIAGKLRSTWIKRVYKPLIKKWKAAVKFLEDNGLDDPVGIDPPSFFLFNTSLSDFGGQIVGEGTNMVAGNTTLRIQTNQSGFTIDLPVATGGGSELIAVDYPAFPFNCNLFNPCTALVSLITPGGQSATESISIF